MQTYRKIKRVNPLLKIRESKVQQELTVLEQIRIEKVRVVQEMKDAQRRYMEGVEKLNQIRSAPGRPNLENQESGVDFIKSEWYRLYRAIQDIEVKEKAQMARILEVERELKSAEKLKERYVVEHQKELQKIEQRQLDEIAITSFRRKALGQGA